MHNSRLFGTKSKLCFRREKHTEIKYSKQSTIQEKIMSTVRLTLFPQIEEIVLKETSQ